MTEKVKALNAGTDRRIFQIGETYGADLIASYLSTGMLDAQFDFNLYDKAIVAFGKDDAGVADLVRVAREGLDTYGAHHLMGTITGNHRPRFASLAGRHCPLGRRPQAGRMDAPNRPEGLRGHHAMRMLTAFNLSMPGVPCIYKGDEYADVGAMTPTTAA